MLTSIGYRGKPIRGLPFDEPAAVVPNEDGRVVDPASGRPVPGAYVAGWIKRGPTGFIGTNKSCSMQTVAALVDDFNAGLLTDPVGKAGRAGCAGARPPARRRRRRRLAGDRRRRDRPRRREGRPRNKFTDIADMLAAAAAAQPSPPLRRRLLARLGNRCRHYIEDSRPGCRRS